MIPRYDIAEMSRIWSEKNRFSKMLECELALMKAQEGVLIPEGVSEHFKEVEIRPNRIAEIEETTKHDVIAFCTSITEQVNHPDKRFFHFGVTSSDILDTATSLQIRQSLHLFLGDLKELRDALSEKVEQTKDWIGMGRSHGMAAEPIVYAQKFLGHDEEFKRRQTDYQKFLEEEITAQFSGAVGNFLVTTPEIEQKASTALGLPPEPVSTQVIPRDRHAKLFTLGALYASALERMAVEIRLLHHQDIDELYEGFSKGQKGSSTMPHKKNPIAAENITGMARLLRSHLSASLENCSLWHERDISHSSVERMLLPDHFGILCYATRRLSKTLRALDLKRDRIEAKVSEQKRWLSSFYLHHLLKETNENRDELYAIVQRAVFTGDSIDEHLAILKEELGEKAQLSFVHEEFIAKTIKQHFDQKRKACSGKQA